MIARVTLPLSIEEIEIAEQRFKESLQREASRYIRRHNSEGAIAALEAVEYLDKFVEGLKVRAGSRLGVPARAHALIEQRDAEWTHVVLEIPDKILTPEQGLQWLTRDRELRAQHVNLARRLRGPVRW